MIPGRGRGTLGWEEGGNEVSFLCHLGSSHPCQQQVVHIASWSLKRDALGAVSGFCTLCWLWGPGEHHRASMPDSIMCSMVRMCQG